MQVALISGGEGDLARELNLQLSRAGWRVLAPSRTEMDVTSTEAVDGYLHQIPRLDLLINNAGVIDDGLLLGLSEERFSRVL